MFHLKVGIPCLIIVKYAVLNACEKVEHVDKHYV